MPQNFKTSHVIVYLFYPGYRHLISGISKHLMLLFIFSPSALSTGNTLFQNISCYCLSVCIPWSCGAMWISKHLMLLFINLVWYNEHPRDAFQNISCYCLSILLRSEHSYLKSFQNISCYCLSTVPFCLSSSSSSFQNISCYCLSLAFPRFLVSPLPFFPLYFLYFSIFYQPTPLSWTALLIIP